MKRRDFLAGTAAAVTALSLPHSVLADTTAYAPGVIKAALKRGETVFVGFSADWCSTCKAQERVMNKLRAADPSYDKAMTFVRVDWDDYGKHDVAKSRNIPRRSTLIVLRGDQELGRIIAGTSQAQIKELMDIGVAASS